jgi:hypothetical protein
MSDRDVSALITDIDTRILPIWSNVFAHEESVPELLDTNVRAVIGAAVRTAYARGYADALLEDKAGRRAALHKANGYRPL